MRFFPARFLALTTLVPALALFVVVPGCAKQSEGERCGDDVGPINDDCNDGLTCTNVAVTGSTSIYRCCYGSGQISDSRCEKPTADDTTDTGTAGGTSVVDGGDVDAGK